MFLDQQPEVKILEEHLPKTGAGREELISLYSMSFDDARKAQGKALIRGPLFRWLDAIELRYLADKFQLTGDKNIILEAISVCALNDFALPQWCSTNFLNSFRDAWHYRVHSWDEAFNRPNPKGRRIDALRQQREEKFAVYNRVLNIITQDPKIHIDRALFEEVGKEFGICGSLADKYYYLAKKQLHNT